MVTCPARPWAAARQPGRTGRLAATGRNVGQMCAKGAANDGHGEVVGHDSSAPRTGFHYACAGPAHRDLARGPPGTVRSNIAGAQKHC